MKFSEKRPLSQVQPHRSVSAFALVSLGIYSTLAAWSLLTFYFTDNRQVDLISAIVFLGVLAITGLATLALRKTRPYVLAWVLLFMSMIIGIYPAVFYSGIGIVAYLGAFLIAFIFTTSGMRGSQINRVMIVGFIGLICAFLLETFGRVDRRMTLTSSTETGIAVLILIVFILLIWFRFQEFPFRSKIVLAIVFVAGISTLTITAIAVNLFNQSIDATGFQSLGSAARAVSITVDDFIWFASGTLKSDALIPLFQEVLSESNPSFEVRQSSQDLLSKLTTRGESNGMGKNYLQYIEFYLLLDKNGIVVLDSQDFFVGQDHSKKDYFIQSINKTMTYTSPVLLSEAGSPGIYFSAQIKDENKNAIGTLVVRYSASVLQQIILSQNNLVGEQSYAILVDEYGVRLAQGNAPSVMYKLMVPQDAEILEMLRSQGRLPDAEVEVGSGEAPDLGNQLQLKPGTSSFFFRGGEYPDGQMNLAGTQYMDSMPWTVIYIQSQGVIQKPIVDQIRIIQILGLFIGVGIVILGVVISRRLMRQIVELRSTAESIASGSLSSSVEEKSGDELGLLTNALNRMAENLQNSMLNMEHEVEIRTRDLERRSRQLQAAAEVGRAAATIRNLGELLDRSTRLISERFNYYHVGIFLVDDAGRFAVLRAANSEGGKRMLARSHRLGVGQQGIVGFVTSTGKPRIALDVGADAVFFNNPDLPATRSEMALPLISGDRILGALDVQSTEAGAFSTDDISVLQVLADSLAVALENARLFVESQNALESIRRAYGEVSHRSWIERIAEITEIGFSSRESGVVPVSEPLRSNQQTSGGLLSIPIYVREELIGYVEAYKPVERGAWSEAEQETIKTLVDQLGIALESARLYENSQIQAERERLVSEFTSRLQENLDVEAVLRNAAVEIRKMLDSDEVTIVLGEDGAK